ncbi:MAG: hypothetical protein GWP16_03525, partial [Nitrospirae bacterium]|nr:hypothetical protein [Nitrospirota bacterium]
MRKAIGIALSLGMLSSITLPLAAQDSMFSDNRFLLTGYGFSTYADPEGSDGSFSAAFVPIFLYRVTDKFLFEAEVEFEFEDDQVETAVEYAQIDWLATDNMTVVMGKFLTPFGTFVEKLHPAWINKLPTFPLPYQHGQSVVPFGQFGLQLRGGVPFGDGNRRFTYSVYLSNGLQVSTHGHEEEEEPEGGEGHEEVAGMSLAALNEALGEEEGNDEGEEHEDNDPIFFDTASANGNGSLGVGGRVGVIPIRGFEVGMSYLNASYDEFGDLDTTSYGIDL